MIHVKKVADVKLHLAPIKKKDNQIILGHDLIREPYANVICIAQKNSGKTTTMMNIVLNCAGPKTSVFIVSNTINSDPTMLYLKKQLLMRGNNFYGFDSLITPEKVNVIERFRTYLRKQAQLETDDGLDYDDDELDEEDDQPTERQTKYDSVLHSLERKEQDTDRSIDMTKQYSNLVYPRWILILDDLPRNQIKNPEVMSVLKQNRHPKMKTFLLTQSPVDIDPSMWRQADNIILWKGLSEDRLLKLKDNLALSIPDQTFLKLYANATKDKFGFFIIDIKPEERYRRGFNEQYNFVSGRINEEKDESSSSSDSES